MTLINVHNGNQPGNTIDQSWWNQYYTLLTGDTSNGISSAITDVAFKLQCVTTNATVLTIVGGDSSLAELELYTDASIKPWLRAGTDHKLYFGPGSSTEPDVTLTRSSENTLTLDGNLSVTGSINTTETGYGAYGSFRLTAIDRPGTFIIPWHDNNGSKAPIVYLDGNSTSEGQLTLGGRQGGTSGQKDIIFQNLTTGWYQFFSNAGQFHFCDSNHPDTDPFVIQPSGIFAFNNRIINSNGYGKGPWKYIGSFSTSSSVISHGLGYTPDVVYICPTGTNPVSVSLADRNSNTVTVYQSGTAPCDVWCG